MKTAVTILAGVAFFAVAIVAGVAIYLVNIREKEINRAKTQPAREASIEARRKSKEDQNGQVATEPKTETAS